MLQNYIQQQQTKDGSHNVKPSKKVTVVDVVKYTNLVPGKTYEVQGTLYDKATKKPLKINGKKVMVSTKFVAKGKWRSKSRI